jgi:hypothetical protein
VIEDALRTDLARRRAAAGADAGDLPVVLGGRLVAGVDLSSNASLQQALDAGLPLEKLR